MIKLTRLSLDKLLICFTHPLTPGPFPPLNKGKGKMKWKDCQAFILKLFVPCPRKRGKGLRDGAIHKFTRMVFN
mgnify:CR=1 FL=1